MLHKIIASLSLLVALLAFTNPSKAGDVINSSEIINQLVPITGDEGAVVERRLDLDIQFQVGSYQLDEIGELQTVQLALALISEELEEATFKIVGHTDATGDAEQNKELSIKRAMTVGTTLIDYFDFDEERFIAEGVGEEQLKDSIHPTAAVNRRVEIIAVYTPRKIETLGDGDVSIIE